MYYGKFNIWDGFEGKVNGKAELKVYIADNLSAGKNKAVLICPGGGYNQVSVREGEPVALAFLAQGFNVFLLKYEVAPAVRHPQPLMDVSRAMCLIRENAEEWHTDTDKIAVCGFSAGGHLAASLGVFWREKYIQETLGISECMNKPNALILCYPVITSKMGIGHRESFYNLLGENQDECVYEKMSLEDFVSKDTPPAFMWHTFDDSCVPVDSTLLFAQSMRKNNIPFELHIFPNGVHGLALCDERTGAVNEHAGKWFGLCTEWLKNIGLK